MGKCDSRFRQIKPNIQLFNQALTTVGTSTCMYVDGIEKWRWALDQVTVHVGIAVIWLVNGWQLLGASPRAPR